MVSNQPNSEFTVKLVDVMDSSVEKSARSFDRAKKYFLKFNLVVPQGGFSGIETVARTGIEANLDSKDDNFFITGIVKGNLLVSGTLSKCFDRLNDFADCSPADSNSKMAHLNFGSLPKGIYEYLVEVFVSPKIETGGKIELRFGAKASQNQNPVRKPQTGLFFKGYTLGGPIFCIRGTANCPNFGFFFTLTDNTGMHYPQPININPSDKVELSQQASYKLGYTIWNWDALGASYNNPALLFSDELATGAMEIMPMQVTLGLLEVDTSFQGPPVDLAPIKEASSVSVRASLAVDRPDNSTLLKFRVLATNNLKLSVQPASLAENSVNIVTVKVTDAATDKNVNTAIVKASLSNDFSSIITLQETVSEAGIYTLELPPMSAGQSVFIKAEAFNYNHSDATELKVVSGVQFSPHTTQDFDCILVGPQQLAILHKENGEFKISTQNCPKKVDFYLYQPTPSDPLSLEKLSDLTA
ncbi:MAG: hypothetical protein AABW85_05050, partial [archaeon]